MSKRTRVRDIQDPDYGLPVRTNRWQLHFGHNGKRYYRFQGILEVCVWEDVMARHKRFFVVEMSRVVSRHDELPEAQTEVLKRLLELAKS